ncbi:MULTISPECIES: HPr kinase/phosphatase C-terminal domain-containing protein [Rhodopseudomonas]|uniref:Serine kinase n=1 Tax=Rhodopseudomonas palustris TaxID=1076 RepID=A0A0D7EKC0_RHOPL|nr:MULTISPECIES: HPr kinase/phosphatase C-terminal domain-containing protein [Rhodopseudomonas]KIZ41274.1 serine kinase [Rhodopseudomonas palustris]MDF3810611.1 HPr kinase/phosphatase C-terminal domain-containing protein [Rhodopseudomonas sp. BAL398]WOK16512.1 HPr kinase/phosphatase C-terminal domain-containing protein [Rhodopseudomonas sp. BAL398]
MSADAPGPGPSVHAAAVLIGDRAVLIRGASGTGKSRLAFELILAGRAGQIPPAVLVGDDRVTLQRRRDTVIVRPVPALAGLIEIRGLGIRRCDYAAEAVLGLVVDLAAADADRLPATAASSIILEGVQLPRVAVAADWSALPLVAGFLTTTDAVAATPVSGDCEKGIGNHISPTLESE